MQKHLLLLFALCSLLVLPTLTEARHYHRRALEERGATKEDEDDSEGYQHREEQEGDEGDEEEEDEDENTKSDCQNPSEGGAGCNSLRKRVVKENLDGEENPINEVQIEDDDEDEDYYRVEKKSWDSFCEKMKRYWKDVGHGIRDEWCKLRSLFQNL